MLESTISPQSSFEPTLAAAMGGPSSQPSLRLFNPVDLLTQGADWIRQTSLPDPEGFRHVDGLHHPVGLQVSDNHTHWQFYWHDGQLVYVSNSVAPWERLDRHLGRLAKTYPTLDQTLRNEIRHQFPTESVAAIVSGTEALETLGREVIAAESSIAEPSPEYEAIRWLHQMGHLADIAAAELVAAMSLEVLESYLILPQKSYRVQQLPSCDRPVFWQAVWPTLAEVLETRLTQWRALIPQIISPYQRPVVNLDRAAQLPAETRTKLSQILRGFSFRQLGMWLGQEDWVIAQRLHPLISGGAVVLQDPIAPFDQLPTLLPTFLPTLVSTTQSAGLLEANPDASPDVNPDVNPETSSKTHPETSSETNSMVHTAIAAVSESSSDQPVATASTGDWGALIQEGKAVAPKIWKIVCIDDSQAMLNEINRFLGPEAFAVTLIKDSKSALLKISSIKPDLILLDVTMPGIDGYQVCNMIRKSSLLQHIPVIMVTGNKGLVDRAKARLVGATDYLVKPFSQADLLTLSFRYLREDS
jgi:two-component system, chemotaxis family, response regulator PixG